MVKRNAIGQHRIQPPMSDQPRPDLTVCRTKKLFLIGSQQRVCRYISQKLAIGVAEGLQQDQFTDVVQQTG